MHFLLPTADIAAHVADWAATVGREGVVAGEGLFAERARLTDAVSRHAQVGLITIVLLMIAALVRG